ncbi:HAD domain-containing protein [Enterobacter hormaechei]|uniref:HAD domain-containing protein n=1 Tax=Enterobacteriaceae TaxID=543 RepID=UPI00098228DD|nr:HAD domain-containing protein [Leclercia adecarboxylata]
MISSIKKALGRIFVDKIEQSTTNSDPISDLKTSGLWRSVPSQHVVLMLDFDGVLHPCMSETFEKMHFLDEILSACPHLYIVISSSWRTSGTRTYLKSLFSQEYQSRLLGATETLFAKGPGGYVRYEECNDFAFTHRIKAFLIVDDDTKLFPPGCKELLATDYYKGLTPEDVTKIIARYHELMARWH